MNPAEFRAFVGLENLIILAYWLYEPNNINQKKIVSILILTKDAASMERAATRTCGSVWNELTNS